MIRVLVLVCAVIAIAVCQRSEAAFHFGGVKGYARDSSPKFTESIAVGYHNSHHQEATSLQNITYCRCVDLVPIGVNKRSFVVGHFSGSNVGLSRWMIEPIAEAELLRVNLRNLNGSAALYLIGGGLTGVFEYHSNQRNLTYGKTMHLRSTYVNVSSQLPLAGFPESLISLAGFLESKGDIADTNRSNDKHEQSPFCHILLGLQVIVFSSFFVFGLFRLRTAYRRTGWARFYAFEEAQICMIGGGIAALVVMYIAVNAPC